MNMSPVEPPTSQDGVCPTRTLSIDEALDFAQAQVRALITAAPGKLTTYTENGRWVFSEDPWAPNWNGGFLAGMMWAFARRTGDPWWREQAETYSLLRRGPQARHRHPRHRLHPRAQLGPLV